MTLTTEIIKGVVSGTNVAEAKQQIPPLTTVVSEGIKYDENKPMHSLITPEFIEAIGRVLTIGAKKYTPNNWQNNLEKERILSALYRHLLAYHKGEIYDPETDENHLAHIACNAMFLFWYDEVKETQQ